MLNDYEKTLVMPHTAKALQVVLFLLKMMIKHGNMPVVTSSYQRFEAIDLASARYDQEENLIYLPGS